MTAGHRFFRYELRTTNMEAARAFYTDVLGPHIWGPDVSLSPLPERAAAQGAPAHWLGHISTRDVEETSTRIVALGGQRLGPAQQGQGGSSRAVLRDPFGSVLAVTSETAPPQRTAVAWHLLHTRDHELAFTLYSELFGWTAAEEPDLAPQAGAHRAFAWDGSGRSVGSIASTARLPHIHPHWLFFFQVPDIEASLTRARRAGGHVLEPHRTSNGALVAPCEDPQGAAFALIQLAPG